MSDDSAEIAAPHYRAFISYSHADGRFAGWLHRKLEGARLPDKKRLSPIFFDRAELAAGPDLSAQVREALAQSAALVVIASPAARVSRWVGQEIALFRALHPDRPILAALIEGEPAEAFPEALLSHDGAAIEPLAADFRKGKDGKRLGLLKIVAGLTAQPLDRLVQRDAQTRQRRVMAVTAGAVLLSLILSAALVLAIRARAEAERQRADAEGLVEFMLTDLRDKLKGVGRLDVMDSVNQRAMARYTGERDLSRLPDDALLRRARILQAMAEDDLGSAKHRERGELVANEAWRTTNDLLVRAPDDPDRIFVHAQSEYLLGYIGFVSRDVAGTREIETARKHLLAYLELAKKLVASDPGDVRWQRELGFAEGNLCALDLSAKPIRAERALPHCHSSTQIFEKLATASPDQLGPAIDLANHIGWEADAQAGLSNRIAEQGLRRNQMAIAETAHRRFPSDIRSLELLVQSAVGLGKALIAGGRISEARTVLAQAKQSASRLTRADPANTYWKQLSQEIDALSLTSRLN